MEEEGGESEKGGGAKEFVKENTTCEDESSVGNRMAE